MVGLPGEVTTLQSLIATSGPLPPPEAARLTAALLSAIAAAHGSGTLLGPLSPADLLRRPDGWEITTPPLPAAPDRAPTDDFFCAGRLLYFGLTGRLPYPDWSGSGPPVVGAEGEPRFISLVRKDVPPTLSATVHRLLAAHPDDRFPDARSALDALEAVADDLERPEGARSRAPGPAIPGRLLAMIVAAVAFVCGAGLAWLLVKGGGGE